MESSIVYLKLLISDTQVLLLSWPGCFRMVKLLLEASLALQAGFCQSLRAVSSVCACLNPTVDVLPFLVLAYI